jgi:hypothetical protein
MAPAVSADRSGFAIRKFLDLELSRKASKLTQNSPHRNRNSGMGDFVDEMSNLKYDPISYRRSR